MASIWVGDALIVVIGFTIMKMALVAMIEATVLVLGEPDLKYRQCPLAMDKWLKLGVAEHQLALGLI